MLVDEVLKIVVKHCRIPGAEKFTVDTDLYEAGLSSLTTVHLMLALEEQFEVEFTEKMLARRTFQSARIIAEAIEVLQDRG